MKKSALTIILLIAALSAITAQGDYTNGYIIKNDGSLVYGQVRRISKGFTPGECVFKWFDISEAYTFLPGDIEAFGFTYGMRYKTTVNDGKKIFIACLAEGVLDLLYDGKIMYLDGMGLGMVALDNSSGSVNAEGKMVSYNGYRDLIEKLPDPENKFSVPPDISLTPEKMRDIILNYNKSRGSQATGFAMNNPLGGYEELRNQGAFMSHYGVLGGINASKYVITRIDKLLGYFPEMNFFEITPVFGLFYSRSLLRKNDHFSFQAEIMTFKTNVYLYGEFVENYYSRTKTDRVDVNTSFTGIKVPLSLKVSFPAGKLKPFMDVGIFGMLNLSPELSRVVEEDVDYVVRTGYDNSVGLKNGLIGGLAGAGFTFDLDQHHSIFLELRGEGGSGLYKRIDESSLYANQDIIQYTISFNIVAGLDFH